MCAESVSRLVGGRTNRIATDSFSLLSHVGDEQNKAHLNRFRLLSFFISFPFLVYFLLEFVVFSHFLSISYYYCYYYYHSVYFLFIPRAALSLETSVRIERNTSELRGYRKLKTFIRRNNHSSVAYKTNTHIRLVCACVWTVYPIVVFSLFLYSV